MKKIRLGRILLYLVMFIAIVITGGLGYLYTAFPAVDAAPDIKVELTPERVARGKYLANHVNLCMDCHAIREWDKFAGPPKAGTEGTGGEHFNHDMGFPGDIISPNITPYRLANWTDGEIYRAITSGVSKDGRALFPIMPYNHYGKMDTEDVYALIAYVRSLEPIESPAVKSTLDFPLNFIVRTLPTPADHQKRPDLSDRIAYGAYVTNAAGCYDCHTKQEKGKFIGKDFAGGMEFKMGKDRVLRSPNITPHETGIGAMTEADFLAKFAAYRGDYTPAKLGADDFQTAMPWLMYAGMSDDDLKAIYTYLRTLTPVDNKVVKYEVFNQ
ncbi:MAG: c-type cytochrome [Bacteroidetes bacterium]|nr:MAG: c-type cytochrome [Bacteroidota bacterium]